MMSELDDALDLFLHTVRHETWPRYDGMKRGVIKAGYKHRLWNNLNRLMKAAGWEAVTCPDCGGVNDGDRENPWCLTCHDTGKIYTKTGE